jgi:F-type H+-transporting ATPase subunit delta
MPETATPETDSASLPTDTGVARLARVYAQAIVDAADTAGCRSEVLAELGSMVRDVLAKVPTAAAVFASPRITAEEKSAMIDKICAGKVLPTTLHSLHILARHGRLGLLREVVEAAAALSDERDGLQRATFTTAVPLDRPGQESLTAEVGSLIGLRLAPTFIVNPDIIGGLVVRIEDTVYDHSVATSLERLGDRLKQRSINEVQHRRDRIGSA